MYGINKSPVFNLCRNQRYLKAMACKAFQKEFAVEWLFVICTKNNCMLEPWRTGVVTKITEETPSTRRYWIEIPEVESFDFKPGQFVTLDLPIHEKKNKRWRSYSIASSPDGTNVIELVIVLLDGRPGHHLPFQRSFCRLGAYTSWPARCICAAGTYRERPVLYLHRYRYCAIQKYGTTYQSLQHFT